jgi:hypothetical protein
MTAARTPTGSQPEQLSLLPNDAMPVQVRLDERTRRVGLQGVAAARAALDAAHRDRMAEESAEADRRRDDHRPHRPAAVPHVEPSQAA